MNIKIKCDRCKKEVDAVIETNYIAGYYDISGNNYWSRFAREGENTALCDSCMHSDPRYKKTYCVKD